MKRAILIPIFLLLLFSSCKKWQNKYPEDTEKTKVTPIDRLTGKWWTLQSASVNGIDYMDTVKQQFGKYEIYFSNKEYDPGVWPDKRYYSSIKTEIEPEFAAIWRFKEYETLFTLGRLVGEFPFFSFMPCYLDYEIFLTPYTILKLSDSEFKFSTQNINKDTTVVYNFISN